jgi:hypothetical protein
VAGRESSPTRSLGCFLVSRVQLQAYLHPNPHPHPHLLSLLVSSPLGPGSVALFGFRLCKAPKSRVWKNLIAHPTHYLQSFSNSFEILESRPLLDPLHVLFSGDRRLLHISTLSLFISYFSPCLALPLYHNHPTYLALLAHFVSRSLTSCPTPPETLPYRARTPPPALYEPVVTCSRWSWRRFVKAFGPHDGPAIPIFCRPVTQWR